MNYQSTVADFLLHLQVERGLSQNSLSAYRRDLLRFGIFLAASNIELEKVIPDLLTQFTIQMKDAGLAQASRDRCLSALRTFFAYCLREHGLANPTVDLEKSKQQRRLPKALTTHEIASIIDSAYQESDPITLRDRALIELLYGSGGRISEIVNLDIADLKEERAEEVEIETIRLKGKGSKERIVPLGSFASKALREYMVRVRPGLAQKSAKATSAIFLNQRGTRLSRQSAWQFVLNASKKAGLEEKVSPHVFRHSYATHLLDGGADIRIVQELLGHASVTTTQIYTLITIDKIRESYSLAHPRARS